MKAETLKLRKKRARMAACIALSNFGYDVPLTAAHHPERWSTDPAREIDEIGGHYYENDEAEALFHDEARMWMTYVATTPYVEILRRHSDSLPVLLLIGDTDVP